MPVLPVCFLQSHQDPVIGLHLMTLAKSNHLPKTLPISTIVKCPPSENLLMDVKCEHMNTRGMGTHNPYPNPAHTQHKELPKPSESPSDEPDRGQPAPLRGGAGHHCATRNMMNDLYLPSHLVLRNHVRDRIPC